MGGTISLLGDGESMLLNEILCCQTCAILSSSSRSHMEPPQQGWYLPNKRALPFRFGMKICGTKHCLLSITLRCHTDP